MSNLADFLALRVGLRKVFFLSEYERPLASRAVQPSASSPALPRRWEAIPNQGHFSRTDWLSAHRDFCIVSQSRAVILTSLRQGFAVLGSRELTNISMASWYKGLEITPRCRSVARFSVHFPDYPTAVPGFHMVKRRSLASESSN